MGFADMRHVVAAVRPLLKRVRNPPHRKRRLVYFDVRALVEFLTATGLVRTSPSTTTSSRTTVFGCR